MNKFEREGWEKLKSAAEEFVSKVERGEAKSTRSYEALREALDLIKEGEWEALLG